MGNLALDNNILRMISSLAKNLKVSEQDVVKRAVGHYAEKIKTKKEHSLLAFAGALTEEDAGEMLKAIYNNRKNKEVEPLL